jgi:hypothetical protein
MPSQWQALAAQLPGWHVALLLPALLFATALALRPRHADTHKRGARVLDGARARRVLRRRRSHPIALSLGGVPVTAEEETRHFKLIGTTGTGKSTAIAALLAGALARGDRAVVTDPDGGYRGRFYEWRRDPQSLRAAFGEVGSVRRDPPSLGRGAARQRLDPGERGSLRARVARLRANLRERGRAPLL